MRDAGREESGTAQLLTNRHAVRVAHIAANGAETDVVPVRPMHRFAIEWLVEVWTVRHLHRTANGPSLVRWNGRPTHQAPGGALGHPA